MQAFALTEISRPQRGHTMEPEVERLFILATTLSKVPRAFARLSDSKESGRRKTAALSINLSFNMQKYFH